MLREDAIQVPKRFFVLIFADGYELVVRGVRPMIDLKTEKTLRLQQVGKYLPPTRNGKHPTLSCVLRWILQGVKLPSGETVRLEAIRISGRWITSVEALQRFAERQTPVIADTKPTATRTPTARQRAVDRADRELAKAGI